MSKEYESMEVEKWVNLEVIADHLSVSTDTVRNWIQSQHYRMMTHDKD